MGDYMKIFLVIMIIIHTLNMIAILAWLRRIHDLLKKAKKLSNFSLFNN